MKSEMRGGRNYTADCQTHLPSASGGQLVKEGRKSFSEQKQKRPLKKKRQFEKKKTKADGQRIRKCKCGME